MRRTIIIGSAPAGYPTGIHAGRAFLNPLLTASAVEADGELVKTTEAENFTGFPGGIPGLNLIVTTEPH